MLVIVSLVAMAQRPAADAIITNAKVWTVDPERPTAEAVAIIGERIVAVGSAAEIDQWRGAATRIIDGGGRLMLPGFNDSHVHFASGGQQLDSVDLETQLHRMSSNSASVFERQSFRTSG